MEKEPNLKQWCQKLGPCGHNACVMAKWCFLLFEYQFAKLGLAHRHEAKSRRIHLDRPPLLNTGPWGPKHLWLHLFRANDFRVKSSFSESFSWKIRLKLQLTTVNFRARLNGDLLSERFDSNGWSTEDKSRSGDDDEGCCIVVHEVVMSPIGGGGLCSCWGALFDDDVRGKRFKFSWKFNAH